MSRKGLQRICRNAIMYTLLSALVLSVALVSAVSSGVRLENSGRRLQHGGVGHGSSTCIASSLGYQCSKLVCGGIRLHWSLGGSSPDLPGCQFSNGNSSSSGATDATATVLHVALHTDMSGQVAMAFPQQPGHMFPADGVVGWVLEDGSASVKAYVVQGYSHDEVVPDPQVPLSNVSAARDSSGLTICFSRPLEAVGQAGVKLQLGPELAINFAAWPNVQWTRHAMDSDHLCDVSLSLLAELGPGGDTPAGGAGSGDAAVNAHGILMTLAWVILLPSGILAARHRWLFSAEGQWFQVHRACQLVGCTLFLIAFIIPFRTFSKGVNLAEHGGAVKAHFAIGVSLVVLVSLQLLLAFLRPHPSSKGRAHFNLQHWWTGRALALLAVINVIIGVQIYHEGWHVSRTPWYSCVFLAVAALGGTTAWLELKARQLPGHGHVEYLGFKEHDGGLMGGAA